MQRIILRVSFEENQIHTIVLGLPKHMNGDLGERAQISIDLRKDLKNDGC